MKKQQNNSARASALKVAVSLALLSISAVLLASSFKGAPVRPSAPLAPSDLAWSIVASPSPGANGNELLGVTCASASDCWAVGDYYNGSDPSQTLIEHWNGTLWSIVASPNTGAFDNYLRGVTCASASDCWAVGYVTDIFNPSQTLVEHWNGLSWSIVASPSPGALGNQLFGVTCASASDCWAVGVSYTGGNGNLTLIEHWNGASWSIVASPNPGTDNALYGVTCASASDCWAVGVSNNQTLVEHWNGLSWSIVATPSPSALGNFLNGVTCASASDCWAVGTYINVNLGVDQTLTEHWNGTSWSVVASPNNGTSYNYLYGVTCASASDCWAAGYYDTGGSISQTLIEHWNGTSWSIVASPNNGTLGNGLNGVTCVSALECWTVGTFDNGPGVNLTLIEEGTCTPTCQPDGAGGAHVGIHITRAATTLEGRRGGALTQAEIEPVPMLAPPTRSTFMATWSSVSGATSYHLDVSTSSGFASYVNGYQDLDVGQITSHVVTGLKLGATYHYRVRAYNAYGILSTSAVKTATTAPGLGRLVINPDFDDSITHDPNAAAIEAMILRAISIQESLFNDPIVIQIRFRYATTWADDCTPLPAAYLALSQFPLYATPWNNFVAALRADHTTGNDAIAIASLPQTPLSSSVVVSSANGRALGLPDTPPAMCANGCVQTGCPYDGIITLNSDKPFLFTRPPTPNVYDAQRITEHEIDEVMGLGSFLPGGGDVRPQDLFSWEFSGTRNRTTSGPRYFSIDSGQTNIVDFNQSPGGDFGDWASTSPPHQYVQNAFTDPGQIADIRAFSPEGINLDIIGYNLSRPAPTPRPRPTPAPRP